VSEEQGILKAIFLVLNTNERFDLLSVKEKEIVDMANRRKYRGEAPCFRVWLVGSWVYYGAVQTLQRHHAVCHPSFRH